MNKVLLIARLGCHIKFVWFIGFAVFLNLSVSAQQFPVELVKKQSPHSGKTCVTKAINKTDTVVFVYFHNGKDQKTETLNKGGHWQGDLTCDLIQAKAEGGKLVTLYDGRTRTVPPTDKPETAKDPIVTDPNPKADSVNTDTIIARFRRYLEKTDFYSEGAVTKKELEVSDLTDSVRANSTAYGKPAKAFIASMRDSIQINDSLVVTMFLKKRFPRLATDSLVVETLFADSLLTSKHEKIEGRLKILEQALNSGSEEKQGLHIDHKSLIVGGSLLLLIVGLILWYRRVSRKQKTDKGKQIPHHTSTRSSEDDIVIINSEAPVLRKQNIGDVLGSEDYLRIATADFCKSSAIHNLYIKNACIIDIYNMYANDLRNPDNPKEDGCMVVGRWVKDEESDSYDVTLEQIVLPGDDAVFSEYELNFGGKIKLRERELLRKLRQCTNLQYDLTCWVHSHPGLGVFFSSSDNNVHNQLKHTLHPLFLTAIVVDILTPDQELGIFTYRSDGTLNAKADLTKLYSLEEMYRWALQSQRKSFKADDHYDTLAKAASHNVKCQGVQLSNGAVIDMAQISVERSIPHIAHVHGFTAESADGVCQHVVQSVAAEESVPDQEHIGVFVIAPHCSIPSVRKTVGKWLSDLRFVFVYTPTDGLLTTIPVVDHELAASNDFYGEQTLEELKIWTRRKR